MSNGFVAAKVSSCCQLDVDDNRLAQPLCSGRMTGLLARTGWSVPVLRIGTLASWWSPLGLLPWHRSDRVPQFPMRARIRLAPPLRRSPSAPYPGVRRTDPRGSRSLWFWRQVSGSRRFNRGSVVFAFLIPTCPRWTSDFDTHAHHRRLYTAAAWRGLEPAPGSGLRRAFLHLSCSLCTIGQFIANLPFLRLRRTPNGPVVPDGAREGCSGQHNGPIPTVVSPAAI